ncbi:hypothetical protein HX99_03940 [Peptococcaceae bacterium SCADC1_2_3]|nr:hypothetical protein DK28_0213505 [Peptococcaceae bacterium SCADC1_2_3]KFI36501.1 hypothetical protein HX99_03940 [Peptococcaceae bacterium SCADC1_2_3]HCJ78627.1 hypothetical protein [Desulfotomaculum sp.]
MELKNYSPILIKEKKASKVIYQGWFPRRRSLEVADIFRAFGPAYREAHGHKMTLRHLRAMRAIEICRTAELGGHV